MFTTGFYSLTTREFTEKETTTAQKESIAKAIATRRYNAKEHNSAVYPAIADECGKVFAIRYNGEWIAPPAQEKETTTTTTTKNDLLPVDYSLVFMTPQGFYERTINAISLPQALCKMIYQPRPADDIRLICLYDSVTDKLLASYDPATLEFRYVCDPVSVAYKITMTGGDASRIAEEYTPTECDTIDVAKTYCRCIANNFNYVNGHYPNVHIEIVLKVSSGKRTHSVPVLFKAITPTDPGEWFDLTTRKY